MHYELQRKRQQVRNRERKIDEIYDVNLTSTKTQFQETQGQSTSNTHKPNQNQEPQCLQGTDVYQDVKNIIRINQSNDREFNRKAVNNPFPETNNNLCKFNLNSQDRILPNYPAVEEHSKLDCQYLKFSNTTRVFNFTLMQAAQRVQAQSWFPYLFWLIDDFWFIFDL